jgi:hypothetical protein
MKDYTHEKNPWKKPFIYKNNSRLHMNWARILETFGTSIFIAFLIFAGGRFGVFERTVVMQDTMKEDIAVLQENMKNVHEKMSEANTTIGGLQATASRNVQIIDSINRDLKDIRQRQQDYFLRNQTERRQDLEDLKSYIHTNK